MLPGFLHFSPTNKDRPEHRGEFIAKCAAMLRRSVSFTIVEDVTTPSANLYGDLIALFGQMDPSSAERWQVERARNLKEKQPEPTDKIR